MVCVKFARQKKHGNVKEVKLPVHDIECKLSPAHEREREKHHKGAINFSENFLCIFFIFPILILFIFIAREKHTKVPISTEKNSHGMNKSQIAETIIERERERWKIITAVFSTFDLNYEFSFYFSSARLCVF